MQMEGLSFYDSPDSLSIGQEEASFQVRIIGLFCITRNKLQGLFNQGDKSNLFLYVHTPFLINRFRRFLTAIALSFAASK